MTDRPIIFSAPMVRALLDGRKSMTRRLAWGRTRAVAGPAMADWETPPSPWRKVQPGDRLWVRENCLTWEGTMRGATYRADHLDGAPPLPRGTGQWSIRNRNSIHMPRWVSRLTLIVTAAKVERLQAISDEEAKAEGAELLDEVTGRVSLDDRRGSYRDGFRAIWESLHGSGAWEANPEVVAISFDIVKANIDATIGER